MFNKACFNTKATGLSVITILVLLCIAPPLSAKQNIVAVEGASYNVDASMSQNLQAFVGKKIQISLRSGNTFSGIVKMVGNHFVHLEKLDGREYFDALIRIEDISAIDSRFRTIQR